MNKISIFESESESNRETLHEHKLIERKNLISMSDGKSLRFRRNALSRDRSSAADLIIHGSDRSKALMGNVREMANTEVDVKKTLTRLLVEKYLMKVRNDN